jgi:hypothetical protein
LQFHVLVGEPDSDRHAVKKDAAGAVGFIRVASGHPVAVIATAAPLTAQELRMIGAERENPMGEPAWDNPVSIVVWGVCVDDGTPHLIDIASAS